MFKIYWTNPDIPNEAHSKDFVNLTEALSECESLRRHQGDGGKAMSTQREVLQQALEAFHSTNLHMHVAAIDAIRAALAEPVQEPVAWGAFYFGGRRNGKLYSHCDTQAQIEAYIADRHQSDDSNTFRAAPLYTAPPQRHPHRTVTYVCPVCAASLERKE